VTDLFPDYSENSTPLEQEFRRIYRKHYPWLVNWLALRVDSREDAEDLAQDVFLVLYRKFPTLTKRGHLHQYIYGIASKVLLSYSRKDRSCEKVKADAVLEDTASVQSIDSDEGTSALRNAIQSLPKKLELVVETYYSRKLTYEETAEILGISRGAVQSRLRKALKILRAKLEKYTVV